MLRRHGRGWILAASLSLSALATVSHAATLAVKGATRGKAAPPQTVVAASAVSSTRRKQAGLSGAQRVGRLIADIDSSVRKQGADGEIVFATLLNYDGEVEASLRKELEVLNQTLSKLTTMQGTYTKVIKASQAEVQKIREATTGTQRQEKHVMQGTLATRKEFDRLLASVGQLINGLQHAALTPNGDLIMQTEDGHTSQSQVPKTYQTIRKLLAGNLAIRPLFPDVFSAFMPTSASKMAGGQPQIALKLRMQKGLLGRTISALQTIQSRLESQQAKALLQVASYQTKIAVRKTAAENGVEARQGIQANKQENIEELAFSRTFTGAVIQLDQDFYDKVLQSMKTKAQFVEDVRHAREAQEQTLTDLIDLLDGRYSVDEHGSQEAVLPVSLSFVETQRTGNHRQQLENLQFEIETALHNKADTHNILLRVKAMLDDAAPLDTGSMQNVLTEMEGVLRTVDDAHERAGDAKQKCESEELHAAQAQQGLQVNLALMASVRNNTRKAIKASKANLKGIHAKTRALENLARRFTKIVNTAGKNLEDQSRDRNTIMIAVQKVGDITGQALANQKDASAVTALLRQLLQDLQNQDRGEQSYFAAMTTSHGVFLQYVQEYLQLLRERRSHCETSLSALKLYYTDVVNDAKVQQDAVKTGSELENESEDLCKSIMEFYQQHHKRRTQLSNALRNVLPKVPDALTSGKGSAWEDIV